MAEQQKGKGRPTGAGGEAAEGIHGAKGGRDEAARTSIPDADDREKGSEPLDKGRTTEHRSGYGGSAGKPVTSSDQREDHSGAKGQPKK